MRLPVAHTSWFLYSFPIKHQPGLVHTRYILHIWWIKPYTLFPTSLKVFCPLTGFVVFSNCWIVLHMGMLCSYYFRYFRANIWPWIEPALALAQSRNQERSAASRDSSAEHFLNVGYTLNKVITVQRNVKTIPQNCTTQCLPSFGNVIYFDAQAHSYAVVLGH